MKPPKSFRIGEIIAPRFWRFEGDYLYGPSIWRKQWHHNEPMCSNEAVGGSPLHGTYAFKKLNYVYDWLSKADLPCEGVIVGTVKLWGAVLESTNGWRAEYGRVHSLNDKVLSSGIRISYDPDLRHLRKMYGATDGTNPA